MTTPTDELEQEPTTSGWLGHLTHHAPIARAGLDLEGVHQVRVAGGRLDVFLRLGEWRVLRDDLRWLRSRASAVRDFDVLLARSVHAKFDEWLASERMVARAGLLEALESTRFTALVEALGVLPPLERRVANARRDDARRKVDELARRALKKSASLEAFHALRRATRRLRYAEDWLGAKRKDLERLQDALGALNDAAVAQRLFNEFPSRSDAPDLGPDLDWTLEKKLALARQAVRQFAAQRER